jgi:ribosomal protein S18 acetylase RimI-like enzyme
MTSATAATVRPATLDDIADIVRLRVLMLEDMGLDPRLEVWSKQAVVFLEEALTDGTAAAFVADAPVDDVGGARRRVVASGVGTTCTRLPGPNNPTGRYGYIMSMSTEPAWRRQGLARSIVTALMDWFGARGIDRVDLHASAAGDAIYRSLGFTEDRYPELRWKRV